MALTIQERLKDLRVLFFNGIDSVSISRRFGHAHVSTTIDVYSHVIKDAEERISDCVVDVIFQPDFRYP